ncbi:hypothetical protein CLOSTMETH_00877 [[Clostridium] methylpentosum DSM 5476]|uniref:Uncharacterized protein n=1 Tax=[Clostridium] methylpentosum DSM 5476 TaxID=537013 RepID=C0EAM0_9FIRM|nr:hypothetical protein CLOSTMETH_00877 [[Clostridium] methylpentosum DSM 5476]
MKAAEPVETTRGENRLQDARTEGRRKQHFMTNFQPEIKSHGQFRATGYLSPKGHVLSGRRFCRLAALPFPIHCYGTTVI